MAHARRKFFDLHQSHQSPLAGQALDYFGELYGIEREVAALRGVPAHLVDDGSQIAPAWLLGRRCVGVTAGASAPESLVREVKARLVELGAGEVQELAGIPEDVNFPLPKSLA